MKAMVACAGLGERLRPLTDLRPKPACPVLDRPLVHFNLALLPPVGVDQVVVNTHQLPEVMGTAAQQGCERLGLGLTLSHEPILLGTGGGLKQVESFLGDETFLLLNGKILFDVDLRPALAAHRQARAAATLVVVDLPPNEGYRPVYVGTDGRLLYVPGFEPAARTGRRFLFTGIHILEPAIFRYLPPVAGVPYGIFEHGYRGLMAQGATVLAHVESGAFHDPSTPARYLRANLDAASGRFPLARFSDLGLKPLHPGVGYLAENATVEGEVVESVIGAGVHVPASARVRHSVLWSNTQLGADEHLERSIGAGTLRLQV
jgi:mannose-1-phosphate guanylyltransferase